MLRRSPPDPKVLPLANHLIRRKEAREEPYVLLLGTGVSIDAECLSFEQLVEQILEFQSMADESLSEEQKYSAFLSAWNALSRDERYSILKEGIKKGKKYHFEELAYLIKAGYFSLIFTTNVDSLLEDALLDAGLRSDDFKVLVNGEDDPNKIIEVLDYAVPRVKVFKLHGDLNSRTFAITDEDIFHFAKPIEDILPQYFNRDL